MRGSFHSKQTPLPQTLDDKLALAEAQRDAAFEEVDKFLPHKRPSPPAHQIAVLRVASRKRRQIAMARQRLHGNPVLLRAQADKRCHKVD